MLSTQLLLVHVDLGSYFTKLLLVAGTYIPRIWPRGGGRFPGAQGNLYQKSKNSSRIWPTVFREGPKFTKLKINKINNKKSVFLGPAQRGP